jgi:TonB family protein
MNIGAEYPAEARALNIQGTIRVRLVVDEHGRVRSQALLNSLGHGLDELAMDHAAKLEFEPAHDSDDKPVSSIVIWKFNMTLEDSQSPAVPTKTSLGTSAPTTSTPDAGHPR